MIYDIVLPKLRSIIKKKHMMIPSDLEVSKNGDIHKSSKLEQFGIVWH